MTEVLNISEQEYRGLDLPSYSLLKRLDDSGPRAINRKYKLESEAVDFGSLVDCRLLSPQEFDNKFFIDATEKPTGQLLELADYIFNNLQDRFDNYFKNNEYVEDLSRAIGLFGSIKDYDKRIAKFDTDLFWNYLQAKRDSIGKTVFTPDILEESNEAVMVLKTHPNTAHLFSKSKNVEDFDQLALVSNINGVDVKILVDKVRVDHDNQTITPYDLKTMDFRSQFFKSNFIKFKYYLQGSLYKEVLANWIKEELQLGYTLEDFKFIVYSRPDKYPSIWNMGLDWHYKGLNGFENIYGDHEKGIYELLDDYMFYINNPEVRVDRKIAQNKLIEL